MKDTRDLAGLTPQRAMDYSGRPIGPLRLSRAMNLNIVAGSCIMATLAVLWPNASITAVFLQEWLGASKTLIGLNFTLVGVATITALPGAWFFSRIRRRRETWVAMTATARAFMFGPAIVALLAHHREWHTELTWIFMLCLLWVQAGGVFTSPGWWAWMADLIPHSIWGSFFGRRYRWMLLAQSFMAIAAGKLLDWVHGPEWQRLTFFGIFSMAALLAVIDPLLFLLVPEPVRGEPRRRTLASLVREYWRPIRDRGFALMLLGAGLYMFFYNMPLVFFPLFLRGEEYEGVWLGGRASLGLLSLVMVVYAVATALAANQWGRLADRIGHRIVWILSSFGFFSHISFFFINERNYVWLALLNAAIYGAGFAGQQVAAQNLALSMAPPRRREFYTSMYLAVVNIIGALGPITGGWLADRYHVMHSVALPSGQPASYIHLLLVISFIGILLTVGLVMARVPDARGTSLRPWFGRLLSGDLLRVAWNISVLGTALGVPRRVRAIRRINRRDGNLMLPEIVAALDDPDVTLRREALLALGRLGTPEALDLLRWYVYDPDAAVRAQSLEAIAQSGTPDRVDLLKRALHDPDSRVRRAAVEALGRDGDREAASHLRSMLVGERDGEVLMSVAVALSRLKEFGAVREMLDLALQSDNSTVRAQMLVGLADLLGEASEFHKLWRQDRHWRGSSFAKLARRLRRQARMLPRNDAAAQVPDRTTRRKLLDELDSRIESFLELVQAENWKQALRVLRQIALHLLVLRYGYQGDEEYALEFLSAVSPGLAQRHWAVTYIQHACDSQACQEAAWDGLTLLGLYALVHGQPAT
ncbi:MAG TPA: MFS transporter [Phycisphaerae bacterium]|nr:MFS transporter [Phycisphaerae bacterium]HOM51851.1 MFS transporter [Phycisphaerae bacterium]HON65779.1 MFS transporter [Phycisphaerae bacterium]HOQ88156.1 MFS transporter [Phycisphaerae bacterium]HPP28618.1 MFS transporter [Phycisphaerae bacterium]